MIQLTSFLAAASLLSSAWASPAPKSMICHPSTFESVIPENAQIIYAYGAGDNSSFATGGAGPFSSTIRGIPAHCRVYVNVTTSATSAFEFALWLPTKNYNSRLATYGNGGFAGMVGYDDIAAGLHYGFATTSTNTGHNSSFMGANGQDDPRWALNNPERQIDWGWRAMHGTVSLAKVLTKAFYGEKPKYSYYFGCSTGGRQGLKSLQKYPGDFDGVVAGAPAWWTTHLQNWNLKVSTYNLPKSAPHHIDASLFPVIQKEVFRQCDAIDGVKDGVIMDPYACSFRPEVLLCGPSSNKSTCLTAPQIGTVKNLYSDWVETNQTLVFPAMTLSSEFQWAMSVDARDEKTPGGIGYARMFLFNDTNWPWQNLDYSVVQLAERLNPGEATADNFDLSPFMKRGGKLLHYHGSSDGSISTGSSIYFYNKVFSTMVPQGAKLDDFYRFYLIPGMGHCGNSVNNAPWAIGAAGQAIANSQFGVPGFNDPKHNVVYAIMDWVEKGKAPQELITTKFGGDDAKQGVKMQRPICPYPQKAKYIGGDYTKPRSFKCTCE